MNGTGRVQCRPVRDCDAVASLDRLRLGEAAIDGLADVERFGKDAVSGGAVEAA